VLIPADAAAANAANAAIQPADDAMLIETPSMPPAEEAQGFFRRNWWWLVAVGGGSYWLYLKSVR
jgi:hypothetical protein